MPAKVKLFGEYGCRPYSNYWGGYSQIIGVDISPRVSAPLFTASFNQLSVELSVEQTALTVWNYFFDILQGFFDHVFRCINDYCVYCDQLS